MTTVLRLTLFLFLFLFLPLRNVLVGALIVYSQYEGAELTVKCFFNFEGIAKLFCKEPCTENALFWIQGNVLGGPFSYQFTGGQTRREVFVTFRQLTKADSGLYNCVLRGPLQDSSEQINVIVVDALLSGGQFEEVTLPVKPGRDIVVQCHFTAVSSQQSFFCREPCLQTTARVQPDGAKVTNGRHSVQFVRTSSGGGSVFVSVAQVTPSDSGQYRCGVGAQQYRTFVLDVEGGPTGRKPNPLPLSTTTAQAGPTTTQQFTTADLMPDMESKSSALLTSSPERVSDVQLYVGVGVALAALVVLLALSLLVYCRKRSSSAKDPPEETEYAATSPQAHSAYQNVGLDRQRVEVFSVDSHTKTHNSQRQTHNSAGTMAANTTADHSATPTYSQLLFQQGSSGVVHGSGQQVVYAETRAPSAVQ